MRSLFADDCKILEAPSLPFGGTFTGPDGFEAMIGRLTARFDLEPRVLDVFEVDDSLVITYSHMRLTSRASGRTIEMPVLEMLRTENLFLDLQGAAGHRLGLTEIAGLPVHVTQQLERHGDRGVFRPEDLLADLQGALV